MRQVKLNARQQMEGAGHLFGHQAQPEPAHQATPEPKELQQQFITSLNIPEGYAVWPYLDQAAFAATMDNYRPFAANYNKRVKQENEPIDKHNALVKERLQKGLTDVEAQLVAFFIKKYTKRTGYNKLTDREYNEKVQEFCNDRGPLVKMKRIQPLRYQAELVFQNILHLYSVQLRNRSDRYMQYGITAPRPLQELEVRSDKVTALHRNGVQSLPVHNKTVRNQRQRLEEAGVYIDYVFQGHVAGVRVKINPEILVFTEAFKPVNAFAENQPVKELKRKKLPYNSKELSTKTSTKTLNECQIRDDAPQSSVDKVCPVDTASFVYENSFYDNTRSKEGEISPPAPPQSVKVPKTLSEALRDQLDHPQELAVKLAAGSYFNYVPVDIRWIFTEAGSGTLTEAEFRELIIQDIFKSFSKVYRNSTPYAGSWKKAINEWMDNRWVTHNGHPFNKMTIANYVAEFRWCIDNARRWFIKSGVNPLYPGDYFDMTRKKKHEVGFEYQRERYKRHYRNKAKKEAEQQRREKNAELRKIQGKDAIRLRTEANRFLNGKITLPQLEKYVKDNLPQQYYATLPEYLKKRMNKL